MGPARIPNRIGRWCETFRDRALIDDQIRVVTERWDEVADDVGLTGPERRQLRGNQVLNPFASYGYAT